MRKTSGKGNGLKIGLLAALCSFAALSIFAGGIVVISSEAGIGRWLADTVTYAVTNKFFYKLAASVFIGLGAAFVANMIAYGKVVEAKRRVRATQVRFSNKAVEISGDTDIGKIA